MPRLLGTAFVGVAATVLLAACGGGGTPGGPASPSTRAFADGEVTATARVGTRPLPTTADSELLPGEPDRGLLVRYRVTNRSDQAVVVNDRLPQNSAATGSGDRVDPVLAYVLADGGTAVVTKRTFATRSDLDYTTSIQGSVLEPGRSLHGRAFVALPLERTLPAFATGEETERDFDGTPNKWRLCLGITPGTDDLTKTPDGHVVVPNDQTRGPMAQRLLCTEPEALPAGAAS